MNDPNLTGESHGDRGRLDEVQRLVAARQGD
jgi:hypothetical protein